MILSNKVLSILIHMYIILSIYLSIYLLVCACQLFLCVSVSYHDDQSCVLFAWVKEKGVFVGSVSNLFMGNVSNRGTDFSLHFLVIT